MKSKLDEEAEAEEEEDEPIKTEVQELAQVTGSSSWSRAKRTAESPGPSEQSESTVAPESMNGNVSVWSRGKLVYVAGDNKCQSTLKYHLQSRGVAFAPDGISFQRCDQTSGAASPKEEYRQAGIRPSVHDPRYSIGRHRGRQ